MLSSNHRIAFFTRKKINKNYCICNNYNSCANRGRYEFFSPKKLLKTIFQSVMVMSEYYLIYAFSLITCGSFYIYVDKICIRFKLSGIFFPKYNELRLCTSIFNSSHKKQRKYAINCDKWSANNPLKRQNGPLPQLPFMQKCSAKQMRFMIP